MADTIAIVGKSGTGKSTSIGNIPELGIKGLNPKETAIINVAGKNLPFKGWKKNYTEKIQTGGNYFEGSDSKTIVKIINYISEERKNIKQLVIDDGQFIMAFEFMARASEPGYTKFADIGVHMGDILSSCKKARQDLKIFFLWHPELDNTSKEFKMKTVGAMIDNYLTLEGLFTVILYTKVTKSSESNKMEYNFVTNNDGELPAKSPIGMFDSLLINNDLAEVIKCIDLYNNEE